MINRVTALTLALSLTASLAQAADTLPTQTVDQALHDRLPDQIKKAGRMISVNNGSFPPYEIVNGPHSMEGASADLTTALSQLLGVKIDHATVSGLSGVLTGINAGRYQLAIGPIGDYPDRQQKVDFIDFVQEFVVFGVQKGNPAQINQLDDTCGKRIAVMAAGSAEQVIRQQSARCTAAGKPAVTVQAFTDQPSSILAVRSKRSDAFFSSQAPLTWFVNQAKGQLELAGKGHKNGFGDIFQGTVVPKGSPLGGVVLDAYKVLYQNGTYAAIMKKWQLEDNMTAAPGLNLAKQEAK
ncbi:polar amino acid transport system substrate-binding protein [Pantoea sp. AN62]|uniref:ABC transporter substrate-binding protein n=1 Tax=Pantoea brenneri TaxID=472694 RepID=A0AAX3J854_9GAMM|nr:MULTISPECIES: ABC transporter substrate-binding protein [Pantoea]KKD34023.1 amino acid ABC transporter [Pantoea sp. 3.5.1]MBS6032502.1 ABC transporter substrate-binding protein [Pantoea sp.]MDH2123192.1 ABC transporter substrate-binding protein [Pantoea brenneri]MDU4125621.1 ABC transporter substrate-binding protein [Pantoea sp.]MDU4744933.1 ABC transporter substrate-binding protein [Pantoea sp.]